MSVHSLPTPAIFHEKIREARLSLGFQTAKDFHRAKKDVLQMSYESFSNIEAGRYLPPADKLEGLVQALEIKEIRSFIFSFCASQMKSELFKSFFIEMSPAPSAVLPADSYTDYREKFNALLEYNRLQAKNELNLDQLLYLESDLIAWDLLGLFVTLQEDIGLTLTQMAEKTKSTEEETQGRIEKLIELKLMKTMGEGKFIVTKEAFIVPRGEMGAPLTKALALRELQQTFAEKRNHPYVRFRFMGIDVADRERLELFIDNFIIDFRKFKNKQGKTHYLQVLFSERHDLE